MNMTKRRTKIPGFQAAALAVAVVSLTISAHATVRSWNYTGAPSGAGWTSSSNWTPSGAPGSGDYAYIANGGLAWLLAGNTTIARLYLGGSGGSGTLRFDDANNFTTTETSFIGNDGGSGYMLMNGGGKWNSTLDFTVGASGTGQLDIKNGADVTNTFSFIGNDAGITGTVNLDGAGSTWVQSQGIVVGRYGIGYLNVSNSGAATNFEAHVGSEAGSTGTVTLTSNGQWTNNSYAYIGEKGTGTLSISGGADASDTEGHIGGYSTGIGTVSVSGSGSTWSNSSFLYIGEAGRGDLTIASSGSVSVNSGAGTVTLGVSGTASGILSIGGGWNRTTSLPLTAAAAGTLSAATVVGSNGSGTKLVNFNLTDSSYTFAPKLSGSLDVQNNGSGTTVLSGANDYAGVTLVNAGTLSVTNATGLGGTGSGTTVASGATLDINGVAVGSEPLTLNGGTLTGTGASSLGGAITLGANSTVGGTGTFTLSGGISGSFALTKSGSGTVILSNASTYTGATTISGGTLSIGAANRISGSTLTLAGGTLATTGGLVLSNAVGLGAGGGTFDVTTGTTTTLNGTVSGSGTLTKTGAGTLALGASNTYTGATTISGGMLSIDAANRLGSGNLNLVGGTLATTADLALTNTAGLGVGGGTFNVSTGTTATLNGTVSGSGALTKVGAGTLVLGATNSYSGGTTVSAGTLSIGAGSQIGGGTLSVVGGTLTTTSTFALTNAVSLGSTGGTFNIPTGVTTLNGAISGSGGLTKTGAGTLALGTTNSYGGGTSILGGTLSIGAADRLSSAALGFNGGTLATTASFALGNTMSVISSGTFDVASGATTTLNGTMIGGGTLTKSGGGTLVLGWTNNATGTIAINAGTLSIDTAARLNSANIALGGGTLVTTGTLTIGNTVNMLGGAISVPPAMTTTLGGTISGPGALTKTGAGTLILGTSNGYTGATTISGGTLRLTGNAASSSYAIASGTTLEFNVASGVTDFNDTTFTGTGSLVKTGDGNAKWGLPVANFALGSGALIDVQAGTLTGGSDANDVWTSNLADLNVASGAQFSGVEANVRVDALTGSGTISSGFSGGGYTAFTFGVDNGSGTFSGPLTDSAGAGNAANFVKAGTGTQILSGNNTYAGATTVSGGTLSITSATGLGTTAGGTTVNSGAALDINGVSVGAEAITLNGTGVSSGGALTTSGTISLGGAITLGSNASLGVTGTLTLDGTVTDGVGSFSLTKIGAGTLILPNANSYDGGTSLNGGTIGLGANGSLGTGAVTLGGNGTLQARTALSLANAIAFGGNTLTFDMNGNAVTLSGGFSGSGNFVKSGSGALTFSGGSSSSSANFTFNSGPVILDSTSTNLLGTGGITLGSSMTLQAPQTVSIANAITLGGNTLTVDTDATKTLTLSGVFANAGGLVKTGAGTLVLTGTNTATLATTISSGTLQIGNGGGGALAGDITNNGALVFNTALLTYGGVISGSGPVTKTGTGTVTLTGSNTYLGGTTISGGTLSIGSDSALGDASGGLAMSGGTLQATGNVTGTRALSILGNSTINTGNSNVTFGSVAGTSGQLAKSGNGALIFEGTNTFLTDLFVQAGKIVVDTGATLQFGNGGTAGTLSGSVSSPVETNGSLIFNRSDDFTWSKSITGTGSFTKTGSGTMTIGTYQGNTGGTFVTGGTLAMGADDLLLDTGALTVDGGTFDLGFRFEVIGAVTLISGSISGSDGGLNATSYDVRSGTISTQLDGRSNAGLTKSGAGTVALTHYNTYTGGTTVSDGSLQYSANDQLGDASGAVTLAGGTLEYTGGSATFGHALSTSSASSGISISGAGTTLTVTSGIGGSGGLTKSGPGTLYLNFPYYMDDYSGPTTVAAGTLQLGGGYNHLGNSSSVTIDSGATLDLGPNQQQMKSIAGAGTILFEGGTLTLFDASADTTFSGVISGTGNIYKSSGTLTLDGPGNTQDGFLRAQVGELGLGSDTALGTTVLRLFGSDIRAVGGARTIPATVQLEGFANFVGDTFDFSGPISTLANTSLQVHNGTTTFSGNLAGANNITFTGPDALVLSGNNSGYTGTLLAYFGTLGLASDSAAGATGLSATSVTLTAVGGPRTIATPLTSSSVTFDGSNAFAFTGPVTASSDFVTNVPVTLSGVVGGSGITKKGSATLTLTNAGNTFGALSLVGGTVSFSADGNLGGGGVTFAGGNLAYTGATGSLGAGRNFAMSGAGAIDVPAAVTLTIPGAIGGPNTSAYTLTKTGAGTLVLSDTNTLGSPIVVSAGVLEASSSANLGSESAGNWLTLNGGTFRATGSFTSNRVLNIAADSTFDTNGHDIVWNASNAIGSGSLHKTGAGTLMLGLGGFGGNIYLDQGTLGFGATNIIQSAGLIAASGTSLTSDGGTYLEDGAITLGGVIPINVPGSGVLTLRGVISGSGGGITKQGSGTLALTSTNTFDGPVSVEAGTLTVQGSPDNLGAGTSAVSLADNSMLHANFGLVTSRPLTLTGGTATLDSDYILNFSGLVSGAGALRKTGAGTLTLATGNTYQGGTLAEGGTINFADQTALGTGAITLKGGTVAATASTTLSANVSVTSSGGTISNGGNTLSLTGAVTGGSGITLGLAGNSLSLTDLTAADFTGFIGSVTLGTRLLFGDGFDPSSIVVTGPSSLIANENLTLASDIDISSGALTVSASGRAITLSGDISGSQILSLSGGDITLSGASTISGIIAVSSATLHGSAPANLGTATVTLDGTSKFQAGSDFTIANSFTLASGSEFDTNGYDVTLAGNINNPGYFKKTGAGTLTFTGLSPGPADLRDGTLALTSQNFSGITFNGGTLRALGSFSLISLSAPSDAKIEVDSGATLAVSFISGAGQVVKTGAGTLAIGSAPLNFQGALIKAGTLAVSYDGSLGDVGTTVTLDGGTLEALATFSLEHPLVVTSNGGGLNVDSGRTLTVNNTLTGSGAIEQTGGGTVSLPNATSYAGTYTVTNGTLSINANAALGTGSLVLGNGASLAIGSGATGISTPVALTSGTGFITNDASATLSGAFTGSGSLTKFGAGSLALSGPLSFDGGLAIGQGSVTLSGSNTFSGGITVGGSTVVLASSSAAGSGGMSVGGGIINFVGSATSVANGLTLFASSSLGVPSGSDSATFSGNITDGAASYGITKTGPGALTLAGNSTYDGGTTISAGSLILASDSAAGTGSIRVNSGTSLGFSGTPTIANSVVLATDATFNVASVADSATLNGVISQTGGVRSLTKTGPGMLTLGGSNTFSGDLILSAGTLALSSSAAGGSGALRLNGGTFSASGSISQQTYLSGTVGISGASPLSLDYYVRLTANTTLDIANDLTTSYYIDEDGGGSYVLTKAGAGSLTISGGSGLSGIADAAGTLYIDNTVTTPLSLTGGALSTHLASGGIYGPVSFLADTSLAGPNRFSVNGTATLGANVAINVADADATFAFPYGIGDGGGGYSLTKKGVGTLELYGAGTFSGNFILQEGAVNVAAQDALGTGTLVLAGGALTPLTGSSYTLSNAITFGADLSVTGYGGLVFDGNATLTDNRKITNDIAVVFDGAIGDGGAGYRFTKAGSGQLNLGGTNTFSGGLEILGGDVVIASSASAGSGPITLRGGSLRGSSDAVPNALVFDGSFGFNDANTYTGNATLLSNSTVDVSFGDVTLSGVIGDGGNTRSLTKTGGYTLVLSGANTYGGGTTVLGGTLQADNDSALGTGPLTLANGAILRSEAGDRTFANALNLSGSVSFQSFASRDFTFTGPATLAADTTITVADKATFSGNIGGPHALTTGYGITLSGNNTFSGGLNVNGSISLGSDTAAGTGAIQIANGASLAAVSGDRAFANELIVSGYADFEGPGAFTFAGNVTPTADATIYAATPATFNGPWSGTHAVTFSGSSPVALSGDNSGFHGDVLLQGANITVGGDAALGDGLVTANYATLTAGGGPRTISNDVVLTGNLSTAGSQPLTLSGAVTLAPGFSSSLSLVVDNSLAISGDIGEPMGTPILLYLGGSGAVTLSGNNTFSGGVSASFSTFVAGSNNAAGTGDITLFVATLRGASGVTIPNHIQLDGTSTVDAPGNFALAGSITGSSDIVKTGTGTLTLSGTGSSIRTLTVNAGTVLVNGGLETWSETDVNSGATLGGTGTLTGYTSVNSGGSLAAGGSAIGTLTLDGSTLALNSGSNTIFQITGTGDTPVAGTDFDSINLGSNTYLGYGGTLTIDFASALTQGATYALFNPAAGHTFGSVGNIVITGAYHLSLSYSPGSGTWQGSIFTYDPVVGNLVAVPEPSAWGAILGGALLIAAIARRRAAIKVRASTGRFFVNTL